MKPSAAKSLPDRARGGCDGPLRALALALGALLAGCEPAGPARERPDVVLIVVDTLRADRLGAYGYPRPTSPRLDRLAAAGARFADVTAQSSWTLPSMVSLFSGRYLSDYRDLPEEGVPQLAETFQAAGYATIGVVANVLMQPEKGYARGFDHYDARPGVQPAGVDNVRARSIDELAADLWGPLDAALGEPERKPLFLYLHPFDPHGPYAGAARLDDELPPAAAPGVEPAGWQMRMLSERAAPDVGDRGAALAELRRERGLYDQDVRLTDEGLARILDGLAARGVLAGAIVAVASDHGECLWERVALAKPEKLRERPPRTFFYMDHGAFLYEEALRTPLLLAGPDIPAGTVIDAPVENVDLFPTLLELCGVPARGALHGRSLVPLLRGAAPADWRDAVFAHVLYATSIREPASGAKAIVASEIGAAIDYPTEAFDLEGDPLERRPLDDPALAARLRARLDAWRARYPTTTTFGRTDDVAGKKLLGDLGYTDAHTGR